MEKTKQTYILVMKGDGGNRLVNNEWKAEPAEVNKYFTSLRDAVESLAMEGLQRFDRYLERLPDDPLCFSRVSIISNPIGEEIMELIRISMEDSPEALPPAGLYLTACEDFSVGELARATGLDLSGWKVLAEEPLLIDLGHFIYDSNGYRIVPDDSWLTLKMAVRNPEYWKGSQTWHYELNVLMRNAADDFGMKQEVFHYGELTDAINAMLLLDVEDMDARLCENKQKKYTAKEINIRDRQGNIEAELKIVKNQQITEEAAEPGVYIHFPNGIDSFTQKVDAGNFFSQGKKAGDSYQMLFRYDENFSRLIPTQAYESWMSVHVEPVQTTVVGSIELKLDWAALNDERRIEQRVPLIVERRYHSIEQAFDALTSINPALFDPQMAKEEELPDYLSAATIYENGKPVVTMENAMAGGPPSLPDIVFSINMENASRELLSMLVRNVQEVECSDGHTLLVRLKGTPPRRVSSVNRTLQPPQKGNRI